MNFELLKDKFTDQDWVAIRETVYAQAARLKAEAIRLSCDYTNARVERLNYLYDMILLAQLGNTEEEL